MPSRHEPTRRSTGASTSESSAAHTTRLNVPGSQNALLISTRTGSLASWWRFVLCASSSLLPSRPLALASTPLVTTSTAR